MDEDLGDLLADGGEGLLDESDITMASTAPPREECSTKKKACKNCSCGRAEEEAAAEAAEDAGLQVPKAVVTPASSCGNVRS